MSESPKSLVKPRFCLRCQELLPAVSEVEGRCFKCGLQYDAGDPQTFRTSREFVWWKFWLPGFCVAVISGILSYTLCIQTGELGFALFIAVPISIGAILGYGCRITTWVLLTLGVVAIITVGSALVMMHVAGLFCGAMLGIIFVIPVSVGISAGVVLRVILKSLAWDQRWFFGPWAIISLLIALPYVVQGIELAVPRRTELETITTELTVDSTPQEAWNAVMFYEDVRHDPPWLLKLALPKPIRSEGSKQRVGEIVTCFYDRGVLKKRISRREEGRLLAFDVIEQHLHFERDVTLKDGSFEIRPVGPQQAKIVLTTRYERRLWPTWMWLGTERQVVHTLHGHVLEGMRRQAEGLDALQPDDPSYPERPSRELAKQP